MASSSTRLGLAHQGDREIGSSASEQVGRLAVPSLASCYSASYRFLGHIQLDASVVTMLRPPQKNLARLPISRSPWCASPSLVEEDAMS